MSNDCFYGWFALILVVYYWNDKTSRQPKDLDVLLTLAKNVHNVLAYQR